MIEILQGISGSGKSTYAKLKQKEGFSVVSRDQLRKDFIEQNSDKTLADYFEQGMECKIEDYITIEEHKLIAKHLIKHHNLIIDNTCLKKKYVDEYVNIFNDVGIDPSEVKIKRFDVPYEICLDRVQKRDGKPISEEVLKSQYDRFNTIGWKKKDFLTSDRKWKTTRDKRKWHYVDFDLDKNLIKSASTYKEERKPAIIVDLDGTLAHRSLLTDPIRLRSFYDAKECDTDYVDKAVLDLVSSNIMRGNKILFVSGRHEHNRRQTMNFLTKYLSSQYFLLFMRKDNDNRSDSIVKYEIFRDYINQYFNIEYVVDDRDRVCSMWRELGLKVLCCGDPNEVY